MFLYYLTQFLTLNLTINPEKIDPEICSFKKLKKKF